jgi:hypothetical protein
MAPKKKKAPAKAPVIKTDSSAAALANMYRGMGSSQPIGTVPRGIVGGESFGSVSTGTSTGATITPSAGIGGGGTGTGGTGASDATIAKDNILASTLKSYGMENIGTTIAKIRAENPEISQDDLLFLLKNDPRYNAEYLTRFSGNKLLKERGLPTVDDATYLKAEKEYERIFTAYGATNLANRGYYGELIANRMDADDVTKRLDVAYEVYKGSPEIKQAFATFYGAVTDGEVIGAMLAPETEIPLLEKKVRVANIGAAALTQKLGTSLAKAEDLEAYGVTTAQAQAGYSTIAQGLTGYEKILEMNRGKDVKAEDVQTQLESSVLKKKAQDIQEVQREVGVEVGRFGGTSGRLASRDRAQGLI